MKPPTEAAAASASKDIEEEGKEESLLHQIQLLLSPLPSVLKEQALFVPSLAARSSNEIGSSSVEAASLFPYVIMAKEKELSSSALKKVGKNERKTRP